MINFTSVYDLVSEIFVASKPTSLDSTYHGPVKRVINERRQVIERGADRQVVKTAKGEVTYAVFTDDRAFVVVTQSPQNLTQVRWTYYFLRNVILESNKQKSMNASPNQLRNYLEVQMNDVNKAINVAAIFPERRPQTDPTFELEIEKWESVSVKSENDDASGSRVAEFWRVFRREILLGTFGVVMLLIAFFIWHKGLY